MKNIEEIKLRIETEENFVYAPKFSCSISHVMAKYPNGLTDKQIGKMLLLKEEEVEGIYLDAISALRIMLGVEDEEEGEVHRF